MIDVKTKNHELSLICFSGWAHSFSWMREVEGFSESFFFSNKEVFRKENLDSRGFPNFEKIKIEISKSKKFKPKNLVLIGWSLGGMIALDFASMFLGSIKGIILISSTPRFSENTLPKIEVEKNNFTVSSKRMSLFQNSFNINPSNTIRKFYKDIHRSLNSVELEEFYKSEFQEENIETERRGLFYLANKNLSSCINNLNTKTLICHGAADKLIKSEASESLRASLLNSNLEIFPGLGHDLPYHAPCSLNKSINNFLSSL